jgi:Fe-S-cluster-containing hydrogenase component 2
LAEIVDARGIRVACADTSVRCNGCAFCYIICPDTAITVYSSGKNTEKEADT